MTAVGCEAYFVWGDQKLGFQSCVMKINKYFMSHLIIRIFFMGKYGLLAIRFLVKVNSD